MGVVMKCRIFMITALAALAVCGCSDSDDFVVPSQGGTSLTIELESGRTYLGESVDGIRPVYWSSGDCIKANDLTSSEAKIDEENAQVAVFEFGTKLTYPCNVLYPSTIYKNATTVTLPSVQNAAVNGTIATNTLPMATCVNEEGSRLKLHHLTGVIHLQLRACDDEWSDKVRIIEFWGGSEDPESSNVPHEQVSGDFTIDYETATLTSTSSEKSAQKVCVLVTGELSTDRLTDVFIVVPAQEYKDGFTVRVMNEDGQYLDKTKPSSQSVAKGEIIKMPEIQFIPTNTKIDIEIPSGQ